MPVRVLANAGRRANLKQARKLLIDKTGDENATENGAIDSAEATLNEIPEPLPASYICPDCGSPMAIIECFGREQLPRASPVRIIAA